MLSVYIVMLYFGVLGLPSAVLNISSSVSLSAAPVHSVIRA